MNARWMGRLLLSRWPIPAATKTGHPRMMRANLEGEAETLRALRNAQCKSVPRLVTFGKEGGPEVRYLRCACAARGTAGCVCKHSRELSRGAAKACAPSGARHAARTAYYVQAPLMTERKLLK